MSATETLGVVGGIISIFSFLFAVWVWLRSDIKVRELTSVIQAVFEISGTVQWEMQTQDVEDVQAKLRQAERSLGLVSGIHTLCAKYSSLSETSFHGTEFGTLIERGIIWTTAMIDDLETSEGLREVWLVTPDLEPDSSERSVGEMVSKNLQKGTRYVFFYPQVLHNLNEKTRRLFANIGISPRGKRLAAKISLVPISPDEYPTLFHRGNTVLYFKDDPQVGLPSVYEEIVLSKISRRGLFWQECDPSIAEEVYRVLAGELHKLRTQ